MLCKTHMECAAIPVAQPLTSSVTMVTDLSRIFSTAIPTYTKKKSTNTCRKHHSKDGRVSWHNPTVVNALLDINRCATLVQALPSRKSNMHLERSTDLGPWHCAGRAVH